MKSPITPPPIRRPLLHTILSAGIAFLLLFASGCSKPSSAAVDISGTWIAPMGIGADYFTTWVFSPDGTFSATVTISGEAEIPATGGYKIRNPRPSPNAIPGDIVECSAPGWKHPELFRIPPNSSTLLIKINCDDDSFSGGRPDCWVPKKGLSPVGLQASEGEHIFTGTVVSTEQKSSGLILQLDTKVHGKRLELAITEDDLIQKVGDVNKLEGKRIEARGQPEEFWHSVLMFLEDAEQLKVLE